MSRHLLFLAFALTTVGPVQAGNWPQWRGPYFNGSTEEKNLPSSWTKTENIAWTADLPGAAASTPIIWENRVFLSGVDSAKEVLQAVCFDRTTGKLLWKEDVAVWKDELTRGIRKDRQSNYASSSPVTDGKAAIFFYGNGDLICFDMIGRRRWERNIQKDYGPFAFNWTFSTSPLLYEGKLYLQVLQRDVPVRGRGLADQENQSYLLAMDPETGKTLWRCVRPSEAVEESREAFTTPIPLEFEGRKELILVGGDALTGHDPQTGKELWRWAPGIPGGSPTGDWYLLRSPAMASFWSALPSGTRCMPSAPAGPAHSTSEQWPGTAARPGTFLPMSPRRPSTTEISSCSTTGGSVYLA